MKEVDHNYKIPRPRTRNLTALLLKFGICPSRLSVPEFIFKNLERWITEVLHHFSTWSKTGQFLQQRSILWKYGLYCIMTGVLNSWPSGQCGPWDAYLLLASECGVRTAGKWCRVALSFSVYKCCGNQVQSYKLRDGQRKQRRNEEVSLFGWYGHN